VTAVQPPSGEPRATDQTAHGIRTPPNPGPAWPDAVRLPDSGWRSSDELVVGVYAFSRRLATTLEPPRVHQDIVDTIAGATSAQQAALATYDEREQALTIVATHGYPSVLVEDLRIPPGSGVIGRVFEARRPLLVIDASRERPSRPRRLRYRTPSFIAVPLVAGTRSLGVVSIADREDGQPFDRRDLTTTRALAAAATLALARERLATRAHLLARAAAIDPLTVLFNRRYFETRLEEEIQRARRYGVDLALLMIDADNFKVFNDLLLHSGGDRILRTMADLLRRSVRAFDVCARLGGEEFAILMPGSNAEAAKHSAERIRQRIADYRFDVGPLPAGLHPTISIGIAVLNGAGTAQDLSARADRALYAAKAAGKNCVRIAET
jgi:diguanylate cyclase (GGDEF)-like protein